MTTPLKPSDMKNWIMSELAMSETSAQSNSSQTTPSSMPKGFDMRAFMLQELAKMDAEKATETAKAPSAGFLGNAGDIVSTIPKAVVGTANAITGLVAPDSWAQEKLQGAYDWMQDNWSSEEAKYNRIQDAKRIAEAKARGESGFKAYLGNVAENPLDNALQFAEQAIPVMAATVFGSPVAGAAVAGAMAGGQTRNEIADRTKTIDEATLMRDNAYYRNLRQQGMSHEEARNQLATSLTEHGGEVALNALSGAVLNRLGGLGTLGKAGSPIKKFATELVTEPADEMFQQYVTNSAIKDMDSSQSLTEDLGTAAAGGLAFGAAGGVVSGVDAALRNKGGSPEQQKSNQVLDEVAQSINAEQPSLVPNDETQTVSTAQPQTATEVNGQAVDNVLNARQFESEEVRKEYENELKSAIKEGSIQEAAKDNTAFGQLARDYLAQTGQTVEPTSTAEPVKNSENPTASQVENEPTVQQSAVQSEPTATIDESRLADYQLELESLAESNPTQTQWYEGYSRLQQAYPEFEQFNTELNRRFVENSQDSSRYSRSAMKSVDANIARGRERMTQAILEKADVKRGMYRPEFGWIDFVWGDDGLTKPRNKKGELVGKGISHIIEARMRKDDMSYSDVTKMLTNNIVETIAKGEVKQNQYNEKAKENRIQLEYNGHRAVLIKKQGNNGWVLTAFELYQDGGQRVGFDTTEPTHSKPTLTRQGMGASDNLPVGGNSQLYDKTIPTQTLPTRSRQGLGATGTDNVQQSAPQSNPQIAQDQATLSRILGEDVARHIEVVDRNSQVPSGKNIKELVTQRVEGWFEISSQKLYLISDNIEANGTFSRDERLAWVAWHELAHKGVRIKFGKILTNLLNSAGKHPTVKAIAQRIQVERKLENPKDKTSYEEAVEEAMMELFSAKETGNWQALADRYQVQIPLMVQRGSQLGKYFAQFANHFRRLIRTVLKRDIAMSDREVFETLQGIKQGIDQFTKNPQNPTASKGDSEARYSLNERADSEFANAVPKRTASSYDEARAIVSELLGEPLMNKATGMVATISKRSLDKLLSGKAVDKSTNLKDHLTAVANIDNLFENGVLGWIEPHKNDDPNIAGMYKLFSPLLIDGEMKLAKITVKAMNFDQGNKIYSVETIEVESENGDLPLSWKPEPSVKTKLTSQQIANVESLIQRIADFNSQSENSANDEQDNRYSRKAKSDKPYQRDLMVTHNISADGILHAKKMGGLPYASVAVTRQQNPLTNFGEVTLIGDRNYIDPKGINKAKVFGADIYSPRYPNVTYEYNRQDINWLRQQFETSAKEIDDNSFDYNFSVGLADTGVRRAMLNSDTVKYQFLKEKGIDYETVYRTVGQSEFANYASVKKAIEQGVKSEDLHNASGAEKYESLMREFIQEQLSELKKFDSPLPLIKRQIVFAENALNGDKLAVQNYAAPKLADGIDNQQGRREIDSLKTKSNMREAVDENKDLFQAYVDRIADQMVAKEKIRKGENRHGEATYMPHTIENVVKKLKKDLRGGEAMNYGLPSIRAKVTPKFKSIEDIQKNKNRLVSHDDFQKVRDEVDTEKDRLAEALGINSWEIDDVLWNVVDENVQSAFHYADIENTAENRQLMADFLAKLEAMPTEYFEGKAKDITQFSDFIGAVVPSNLPKNAYDVLQKSGLALYEYDPTQPSSRAETIKQATDELDQQRNGEVLFSRKQSVADLIKTGKAKAEPTAFEDLKVGDYQGFKQRLNRLVGKVDEWFADSLRPVNDWANEKLVQNGISAHEANRLLQDMYRAKGVRDALNSELEQTYLKPLLTKVAEVAKANKLDPLTAKRLAGFWASLRYSIEKNQQLLKDDQQAMAEAKQALDDAVQNGTQAEIDKADLAYRRATRQYRNRKHDVETTDPNAEFKVGTAGGWSIPEAKSLLQGIEKHIPRADLEAVADLLSDLNQARLEIDFNVGRYTPEQYQEYKANRHYVPLTGDPKADDSTDVIGGAGLNALNVSKDRALKGRKLSEAEDGIDASWRAISNSTTYAGWADFKAKIDEIYQSELIRLKGEGLTEMEAKDRIEQTLGISKARLQGLTRSSDDVLIRKEGGIYYEYRLPKEVMAALKNDNAEYTGTILKVLSTPTSWYARGVTQWTLTFAPMNMARDTWEKSEFIRVQKVYDQNGNELDSKTMDKIGRAVLKNAFFNKDIWTATKRFGFGQDLRQNVVEERLFKDLLANGGVSTYSTYLARTETDLIAKIKKENSIIGKRFEQAGKIIESYNQVFDNVSALSAYKALIDEGVDPKQAAAITLELTNFRKTGSKMKSLIKPLYMFSQPTAMGARNLTKYLATSKGRKRFFAYVVVMMALYSVLRAFDDENEGGNQMDQLGDITRYIPLPAGLKKYIKIPVGFGMPQLAWNYAVNIVKGIVKDISISEAATNMFVHTFKTMSPVSPSEISAAKYPLAKAALTVTPTILQPLMQNALNRSAFGSQITTNFVRDDKLKAEQAKSTTAEFWSSLALEINDTFGIDMHPEQVKNLVDGYGSMFGSLKELLTIFVENPNREQLGRQTRTPFLNQIIGTANEFSIQSRYYEASEEAQTVFKQYESRKSRGKLDEEWLKENRAVISFHQLNAKRMSELKAKKAQLTKKLREKKISPAAYEVQLKQYNVEMDKTQRVFLKRWREIQGLTTY